MKHHVFPLFNTDFFLNRCFTHKYYLKPVKLPCIKFLNFIQWGCATTCENLLSLFIRVFKIYYNFHTPSPCKLAFTTFHILAVLSTWHTVSNSNLMGKNRWLNLVKHCHCFTLQKICIFLGHGFHGKTFNFQLRIYIYQPWQQYTFMIT